MENSLLALLTVAANSYPGERLKHAFYEDGELVEDPVHVGDSVAFSIAQELKEGFLPEDDPLTNLGSAMRMLTNIIEDVEATRAGIMDHTAERIVYDFLFWIKEARRTSITLSLFKSWADVHPSQVVRDLSDRVGELLLARIPQLRDPSVTLLTSIPFDQLLVEQEKRVAAKFGEPTPESPEPRPPEQAPPPPPPPAPEPGKELPA